MNDPLNPFEKSNLSIGLVGYDPLFDKRYMEREKTHPEIQVTIPYYGGIPIDQLPKAGRPWNVPPPLMAGQTAKLFFYDDATLDGYIELEALEFRGGLAWRVLKREMTHRQMVGTNWKLEK